MLHELFSGGRCRMGQYSGGGGTLMVPEPEGLPDAGCLCTFHDMYQNLTKRYMHFANVPKYHFLVHLIDVCPEIVENGTYEQL
jgi:hypothetical protein